MRRRLSVSAINVFMSLLPSRVVPYVVQPACQSVVRRRTPSANALQTTTTPENHADQRDKRSVWLRGNIARRLIATAASVLALVSPHAAALQVDAPPTPEQTMGAYQMLEGWIRDWSLPGEPAEVPFDLGGAHVVLRLGGDVIGRGTDVTTGRRALWNAARAAWMEAAGRLPVERDIFAERNARQLAATMLISLELAGPMTPMLANTMSDLLTEYDPGIHGVAVQIGTRTRAIFPGAMLAANDTPADALRKALIDLFDNDLDRLYGPALDFRSPREFRERDGAVFSRFRVTHLAQTSAGAAPVFLHRGGRIVELHHLTVAGLREWADGMASNLTLRAWPGSEPFGMAGTYNPITGESRPLVATPAEQALVALALRRYAATPGVSAVAADKARAFAYRLLTDLAEIVGNEPDPAGDAASAAMFMAAYFEGGRPPTDVEQATAELFASCSRTLRGAFRAETGFAADVPRAAYGAVAWALVRLARDGAGDLSTARTAVSAAFDSVGVDQLVTHMPWLGFAAIEADVVPSQRDAMLQMRTLVFDHQIASVDVDPLDRDFAGGIVFTRSRTPLPTWQTARPIAFIAAMIREPRLTTPEARGAELIRVLSSLRFLRQLTVDEAAGFMAKSPARAAWGVRSALWDQRMPPDATSLSLMAVCESLRAIYAMSQDP